jgi:hypothetical protein
LPGLVYDPSMGDGRSGVLSSVLQSRSRILELIVAAVVLALGVHLLATYIESQVSSTAVLVAGLMATLGALALLLRQAGWLRVRTEVVEGFFIYDVEANRVPPHDIGYWFGVQFANYFSAAFAENAALKAAWESEPLSARFGVNESTTTFEKSRDLVQQALEYFVLSSLSRHLLDYFGVHSDGDNGDLIILTHTDIPDVLLQNRFLKLFSEPMDERAAFVGAVDDEHPSHDTVYMQQTSGGALYARFELVLPKGSSVKRLARDRVEIDTPRFRLELQAEFDGTNTNVPSSYVTTFLGLGDAWSDKDGVRLTAFRVRVTVVFSPKAWRVLSPVGWEYYRWIDDWLTRLAEQLDQEAYFERISFEQAMTVVRLLRAAPESPKAHGDGPTGSMIARADGG